MGIIAGNSWDQICCNAVFELYHPSHIHLQVIHAV